MEFVGFFSAELAALFLLSRSISQEISVMCFRLTRSKHITIVVLAVIFLPGTIVHELAHYIAAKTLNVRTGEIEFMPVLKENTVKLGSVQIEQTDPIRRFLIGVAPFFAGMILIFAALYGLESNSDNSIWLKLLSGYILFEISNTMFSSKKDMEGALELFFALLFIGTVLYFMGINIPSNVWALLSQKSSLAAFQRGAFYLLIPLGLDFIIIILFKGINRFRIFHS